MGPIIVSRRGASRPDGTPKDVDREFVMFFRLGRADLAIRCHAMPRMLDSDRGR